MQQFIYFHRHGQTVYSQRNAGYGDNQHRTMLTPRGIQEAVLLGQELTRHGPFDLYLTSPLPRAVQTATLVHNQLGYGELVGEPALTEPINEQNRDTWNRTVNLVERLKKEPHRKILLSTHGYIFYCLATYFRGLDLGELKNFQNPPTAAFGWVELQEGKVVQASWENAAHLEAPERLPVL